MVKTSDIIFYTIIIIIFFIILFIAYSFIANSSQTKELVPLTSPVSFGYSCQDNQCGDNLECDSNTTTCKYIDGQTCVNTFDCLSSSYCSGICTSDPPSLITGNLGDPCPCPVNMECIQESADSSKRICKIKGGFICDNDDQCASTSCINGFCQTGLSNGQVCQLDSQCLSNNCSFNICQNQGIVTGNVGAYCDNNLALTCDSGLSCTNNTCLVSSAGLGNSCGLDNLCVTPLECFNNNYQPCSNNENGCVCSYPFTTQEPNPNTCSSTQVCTFNYSCSNNSCLAVDTIPCFLDEQCRSTCSGEGGVYQSYFSINTTDENGNIIPRDSTLPDNWESSIDYKLSNVSQYNYNGQILRLTGFTSSSGGDVLYYVIAGDPNNPFTTGLVSINSNNGQAIIAGYSENFDGTDKFLFVEIEVISDTEMYIVYLNTKTENNITQENKVVYFFDSVNLVPFNDSNLGDLPGTQYNTLFQAIDIKSISVASNKDVLLEDTNGIVWYKKTNETQYSEMINSETGQTLNSVSQAAFYYSPSTTDTNLNICTSNCPQHLNISYILNGLLQFNGTFNGPNYPSFTNTDYTVIDYSTYSDSTNGISDGYISIIARNNNTSEINHYIVSSGLIEVLPGYYDENTRTLVTRNSYYVYSVSSCVRFTL